MAADSYIGRTVGDYVIRERLGQGGSAVVYRAHQRAINRDVALKIIQLQATPDSELNFRTRFTQEAELIASLEHIHILPVYDYGVTDTEAYLAMRLLPGGSLRDRLHAGQPLDLELALDYFAQISKGLAYAHSRGVIHRDVKPANIMLDNSGNVLLTDFGLAKIIGNSAEITRSGTIVGTPLYMSPEQLRGEPLDQRADLYSLGVILYQMLTGRTPFGSEYGDLVTTIYQQLERDPVPPREFNSAIPRGVEAVILRALAKKPDDRTMTATDMRDDLYQALGRSPTGGTQYITRPGGQLRGLTVALAAARRRRWRRWLTNVAGIVSLVLVTVLLVLLITDLREGNDAPSVRSGPVIAPEIIAGATGPATEITVAPLDLARARAALAGGGFIGYVTCTLDTEYHATQAREIRDLATRYNLELRLYDSATDAYREITQIEKARADGATGLIVCPVNSDILKNALTSVQQAGLPLVLLDSNIPSYGGVRLSGDDYRMGYAAGQFAGDVIAAELGGQARVLVLNFPDMASIVARADGLIDGLHDTAPQAQVVASVRGGTREFAQDSVTALLTQGISFDVILSINDGGSFGAIAALEAANIAPDQVSIFSIDAEVLARDYITRGYYLRGSLAINRAEFSRVAVEAMVQMLAGGSLPETIVIPPGDMVTRDTLAVPDPTVTSG